jgi:hypothetical protein
MTDAFDDKYLSLDEDERANCFLAAPDKSSLAFTIDQLSADSGVFIINAADVFWTFQGTAAWKLEAFKLVATRVSPTSVEIAWQSVCRNVATRSLKLAGIQLGGQKEPFCYFDLTFFGAGNYPIYGAHYPEFASIHAKCTASGGVAVWERRKSINTQLDLSTITGLTITFAAHCKICRC